MKTWTWIVAALLLVPGLGNAQTQHCEGSQRELNECAAAVAEAADEELNAVYRAVIRSLRGETLAIQRLREAQRLWIQLRDADIEALYPVPDGEDYRVHQGSIYPLRFWSAQAEVTRARTAWLRTHFLEHEEGQL